MSFHIKNNYINVLTTILIVFGYSIEVYSAPTAIIDNQSVLDTKYTQSQYNIRPSGIDNKNDSIYELKKVNAIKQQDSNRYKSVEVRTPNDIITPTPFGSKNPLFSNQHDQIVNNNAQFINTIEQIINQIDKNRRSISDTINYLSKMRNKLIKKLSKQAYNDSNTIIQLLLENYNELLKYSNKIKNKVNNYNLLLSKYGMERIDNFMQKSNEVALQIFNITQQLTYYINSIDILAPIINKYIYINDYKTNIKNYKKAGWPSEEEFKKFCQYLLIYNNNLIELRKQVINTCNKQLKPLNNFVKEYLLNDPVKYLSNYLDSITKYITNRTNDILLGIDSNFDETKLGGKTINLKDLLSATSEEVNYISQLMINILNTDTNREYQSILNDLLRKYRVYLAELFNNCYTERENEVLNYESEGCKNEILFSYFKKKVIEDIKLCLFLINNRFSNLYFSKIKEIYTNQLDSNK